MNANLAIEREGARPNERGQFSGGPPARQVHLEKAILRVKEAHRARQVLAVRGPDGRNPQPVARDFDWRGKSGQLTVAFELREAGAQPSACPEAAGYSGNDEQHEGGDESAQESSHKKGENGSRPILAARGG